MDRFSRRKVLRGSMGLAALGAVSRTVAAHEDHGSPSLEKFVQPMPIPERKDPEWERFGAAYYELSEREFEQQLHPDLPKTTLWGYDGQFPGPIVEGRENRLLGVRFDNGDLPSDHLLTVDERIHGTSPGDYDGYDGPVPEVRTVTHFHGLNVPPESDGQADMWTSPDGVTGPRFSRHVQRFPNRQPRLTTTYHDHARGISRLNNYAGLVGIYYLRSWREELLDLPDGEYDVPLVLTDRTFESDGSLHYPDTFEPNVGGDTALVNGAVWPYFEVEPRRYRFRILNPSNGRTYDLRLENESGQGVPHLYQIAAGHGFLDDVVTIGADGDLESLVVSSFERAEVVVDFSEFAGETFTMTNSAPFPFGGGHHSETDLPEIMQFHVAEERTGRPDRSTHPDRLRLPATAGPDPEAARETRQVSMEMTQDENGTALHLLNGRRFGDPIEIEPQLGTTEVWELTNDTHHTHPVHLHLVQFRVVGRGPDGTDDPLPNERGGKDVVRVNPGETVRIAVKFGDFPGQYPFHCHVLEHEDHEMMRPFDVVTGKGDHGHGHRGGGHGRGRGRGRPDDERRGGGPDDWREDKHHEK